MITVILTSYNEPKATERAVNTLLKQAPKKDFKIIVVDPFPEVEQYLNKQIKDKRFEFFLDPGEGKAYALNLLLEMTYSKNKEDIYIFTDGDVYVSGNVIEEIKKSFKDKKIGCVTGRPISIDPRGNKFGYWSRFLFAGIDKVRHKLSSQKKFMECSGYLFAMRNGVIKNFPIETSEDSIIPYMFWRKKYLIGYAPKAEVYVKNPDNWKDWSNQKIRNIKAHENLNKIAPNLPRTKSFYNEIKHGLEFIINYPRTFKEAFYTLQLVLARLYIYVKAFIELKIKKSYADGWRETEIESTKPLD